MRFLLGCSSGRVRAFDLRGALVEQFEKTNRAAGRGQFADAATRRIDERSPVASSTLMPSTSSLPAIVAAGDRRVAMAVQHPKHLALDFTARARLRVFDPGEMLAGHPILFRRLYRHNTPGQPPTSHRPKNHARCAKVPADALQSNAITRDVPAGRPRRRQTSLHIAAVGLPRGCPAAARHDSGSLSLQGKTGQIGRAPARR